MANQPPSEARVLLDALAKAGFDRHAVARALSVPAESLRSIARGKQPGTKLLPRLQGLYQNLQSQFPGKLPGTPADPGGIDALGSGGGGASPAIAAPVDPSRIAASADTVAADKPADERGTGERVRDGIRDFLLGKDGASAVIDAAEQKASKRNTDSLDERQARFVAQIAPMLGLAIMLVGYLVYPDPYKPCAPSQAEGESMIRPVLRMAARQLEVAGQLSENTIDILASLAATAVYAERAFDTFKRIHEGNERAAANHQPASAGRSDTAAPPAYGVAPLPAHLAADHQPQGRGDTRNGTRPAGDAPDRAPDGGHTDEQRRATALLDNVLAADAVGRRRLAIN